MTLLRQSFAFGAYARTRKSFPSLRLSFSSLASDGLNFGGNRFTVIQLLLCVGIGFRSKARLIRLCGGNRKKIEALLQFLYAVGWINADNSLTEAGKEVRHEMFQDFMEWYRGPYMSEKKPRKKYKPSHLL